VDRECIAGLTLIDILHRRLGDQEVLDLEMLERLIRNQQVISTSLIAGSNKTN
jgi:hypothetical protein